MRDGALVTSDRAVVELARRGRFVVGEPFFVPGVPVTLDRRGLADAAPGELAVVRTGRGRARLERTLGPADRIETVLEALLEHEGVRGPHEPHDPPPPDPEGRVDLRQAVTFTIDPETARDFDDAIAVRQEGEGLRAWVHIADVAHFVPAGTPLDRGAAQRAFSVYVPGRVAPMLPPELADDLCSLRPHQDRLCLTVEIPFDGDLQAGEASFYRSVIRSSERLTYGRAERILRGDERADDALIEALRLAERLALELRRRRFARGALRITTREIAFEFDGEGGVAGARLESEPHAHMLVEELMILANEAVAQLLAGRRREALYRVHERPDPQAIGHLLAKLADLEVPTPPAPDEKHLTPGLAARLAAAISESVSAYVEQAGRGREAFPALVLRALKQARYDVRNFGHSGLASPAYCHFTSPIRRYPDLVVHRALLRELGASEEPLPDELPELAEHTSAAERRYADIEFRADDICLAWLLEDVLLERGWDASFEGEINGVIGSGLFVRFGEVFEGYLPARRLSGDYYELNELATALVGRRTKRTYRLGDPIEVVVGEVSRAEGKIEVRLKEQ
ncbi:MAG TPA: VacB/RNase II family 3'-5' exoribonuclease [Gaiellaceae bacterium]|nr:VacB/RNase II family 3'-5' exoribonuclease [Gaiellaceae bacterium]